MSNDNFSEKDLILQKISDLNVVNNYKNIKNSNNILFCKDADVSFSLIKNILSKIKYKVTQVKDDMDAYNLIINNYNPEYIDIDRDMFCLIITDLNISRNIESFGYEILKKMKENNIYRHSE
jgi:CheY-like chemotaxis protein